MATKIFITDDHYMIIEGIRSLLQGEKNLEWLGHAMTAGSCMAFLKNTITPPDQHGVQVPVRQGDDPTAPVETPEPPAAEPTAEPSAPVPDEPTVPEPAPSGTPTPVPPEESESGN
jgi:hypothetical protein